MIPVMVGIASLRAGIAPLHCATLVRNGRGLHISGLSGAGKSTLAFALSKRGFDLLSDDWTYFAATGDTFAAFGLPAPIKLLPDTLRFFPELSAHPITTSLNGELAYEVGPSDALTPSRAFTCEPQALLFYRRGPVSHPQWSRLTKEEVEEQFRPALERVPECLQSCREAQHTAISCLAELPAYALVSDGSPQEIAAIIDRHFSSIDPPSAMNAGIPPSAHWEIPDLMLRFVPAPYVTECDSTVRLETDLPQVHALAQAICQELATKSRLHATVIGDNFDWPDTHGSISGYSYRLRSGLGCMVFDSHAGRLLSWIKEDSYDLGAITRFLDLRSV